MRPMRTKRAVLALAIAGLAAPVAGQSTATPFMTFEHEGFSSMLADERDQGLARAIAMLPDRIGELPGEIPDMPAEAAGMVQLFLRTIAKPARVAIVYDGDNPSGGFFGYGFVASVECDNQGEVNELRDTVLGVADMIGREQGVDIPLEESQRFEGMSEMMLPFGLLSFGPRESDSGWRYEIVIGTVNDPDAVFHESPDLIGGPGFQSVMTATMDFSAMTPAANIATNMAGAQAPQVREFLSQFEQMGLVGEDALRMSYQTGYTADASVHRFVMHDARRRAEALSMPTGPLTASDLRAIPADVFGVSIGRANFGSIEHTLDEMADNGLPVYDALDAFEEETGVDFIGDVVQNLGGTFAFYNSESTGGGSLLSMVVMASIENQSEFMGAMHTLSGLANGALADSREEFSRYVRLQSWTDSSGADLISLHFPGLPVPLELSLAFTDDWFIMAPTPQAAVAAARQAAGEGDAGLTANPRFASAFPEIGQGATSLSFIDTPRTIADGYPMLALLGSGLANMVRSPDHPGAREPGMVLPLYRDLVNDSTRPTLKVTRWEGEDMTTTVVADRSVWVQTGGEAGVASAAIPLLLAGVGAAAVASNEMRFGFDDLTRSPMAIVEHARRSFYVDPTADFVAALTAVHGLQGPIAWLKTQPQR